MTQDNAENEAKAREPTAAEYRKALEDLVFYVEWHMPYKGHHPTYSTPMLAAHSLLQRARSLKEPQ